jgi:phage protein D
MRIAELEHDHGDFYVPTFVVKVGGEDVFRDLYLAVSEVSVDLKEKAAGRFSATIVSAFDWEAREFLATRAEERVDLLELFAFGRTVEIALGYGDPTKLDPMLTGLITEITTEFGSGSTPALVVSGYDQLYPLTIGKNTRHWENNPDSTAVTDIAAEHHVDTDVRVTSPVKERIDQNNETDMAFVVKLAERNGATFYHRDRTLYFGRRQNDASDVVELGWGEGLLGFSPEANLARQIAEVQVHGRSAAKGEAILGRARRGEESGRDGGEQSGGQRVVTARAADPVLHVRAAVRTQAEADARAKAVLEERAQDFVTGSGESIGVPEILPDTNIALTGLGRAFSKTYYVSEATHKLDRSGYHTTFKVQETTV